MVGNHYSLEVRPSLPQRLERLDELANDLTYAWERSIRRLFYRIDPHLWDRCGHNPKVFLRRVSQARLNAVVQDRVFMQNYAAVLSAYDAYLDETTPAELDRYLNAETDLIAYFCAEFGFHESLPIYSGGLGILAGDHCKAASDLALPFVAVGLLYRQGYFHQTIDGEGRQIAHYPRNDFSELAITAAVDPDGVEIQVTLWIAERDVTVKVWQAKAGHITLYLLDSDLPVNHEEDRHITNQLYGGDRISRIRQELVLGIGGVRALRALGHMPSVWHINEGHAAFMIVERCRELVEQGLDFDAALEAVAAATVFTTHTPVAAGHDLFERELVNHYLARHIEALKIPLARFLELDGHHGHQFNMTALALRGSRFHNGVSRIHGAVASFMGRYAWPQIPVDENPIHYVTNGVHLPTFLASEWVNLFDSHFGADWRNRLSSTTFWQRIDEIPDHGYWSARQSVKSKMLELVQSRATQQHRRNGLSDSQIERLTRQLNPRQTDLLVIGFARRFATYKRATLLFSDPERLARLLNDPARPVLLIFAGKAHPNDHPGQQLIKTIHDFSRRSEFEGKIVMLEGYDLALSRKLVSGVDVWLNTPEYPLEASGTSGQKASMNGVINLSVLDGWWGEGYDGENGWAVAPHGPGFDPHFRDREEALALYEILERQVIPLYFDRRSSSQNTPNGWVKKSKAAMKSVIPRFNAQRMLIDYIKDFYAPAQRHARALAHDNYRGASELAEWKQRVRRSWPAVGSHQINALPETIQYGQLLPMAVAVRLNGLSQSDFVVECLVSEQIGAGQEEKRYCHRFSHVGSNDSGEAIYQLEFRPPDSGLFRYQLRLFPYHPLLAHPFEVGCMQWL